MDKIRKPFCSIALYHIIKLFLFWYLRVKDKTLYTYIKLSVYLNVRKIKVCDHYDDLTLSGTALHKFILAQFNWFIFKYVHLNTSLIITQ